MAEEQTLSIRINADGKALLSTDRTGEFWTAIHRSIEERAKDALNLSPTSIILPWWQFIRCRNSILYLCEKWGPVNVSVDEPARRLLEKAIRSEDQYQLAQQSKKADTQEIEIALRKSGFRRTLKSAQLRNVAALLNLPAGATFSVPGAGKTTEALALFQLKRGKGSKLMIICPKNAFVAWEEQTAACFDSPPAITRLEGKNNIPQMLENEPAIALITYQQLITVEKHVAEFLAKHEVFLFVDESHRMKRGDAGAYGKAILSLCHLPVFKLILSGTPMPNSEADLEPQIKFLFPELTTAGVPVKELIKPIYVRTTKAELNLPPLEVKTTSIPMTNDQARLYRLICSEEERSLEEGLSISNKKFLRSVNRSVMRLLQVVSNPALLARTSSQFPEVIRHALESDSPKIAYVCHRARTLAAQRQKILIWSTFVENVELVSERLRDIGADFIHGETDTGSDEEENTRECKIKRFKNDSGAMVLVANPAACGEGISLHDVCHYAIYLDRSYNAAHYLQSQDRIHRLGLSPDQKTSVEIVVCPNTIDESVFRRLKAKVHKMADVLNDPSLREEAIPQELEDLLDEDDVRDLLRQLKGN